MRNVSAFQPKSATGLNSGLVAYYRMDGNGNDSIGSRNLSTNGTVNFNTGKIGSSADFGDTDSHGNCLHYTTDGLGIDQRTNWTMSLWLKINTAPTGDRRFVQWESTTGASRELSFRYGDYTGTKSIRCSLSSGASEIQYDTTLSIGTWYHLAFTCDGSGNVSFYFNGTLVDTGTMGTNTGGNFLHIGSANTHVIGSACDVDELGFWNRTLSASEVSDLYLSGDGRQLPNQMFSTKAYYPLNGNSRDYSINGNHGTDTAITYPQGRFGQGARFNGTSSFINGGTSTSLRFSPSVTQVVWFRNTISGTAGYFLAGKWSNNTGGWISYGMYMNNGAVMNLLWRIKTGAGVTFSDISVNSLKINDNQWHCAVGTYDAGTQRLYLDGRLVGSGGSGTSIYYDSDFNFLIGAGCNAGLGNDVFYNGLIDEVIIESRAWTAKEVETYYRKSVLNYRQRNFAQAFITFLVEETLTLVESVTALRSRLFTVAENLGLVEAWTALKGISFDIADSLGLIEGYTYVHNKVFSILETLGLIESTTTRTSAWTKTEKDDESGWTKTEVDDDISSWTKTPRN